MSKLISSRKISNNIKETYLVDNFELLIVQFCRAPEVPFHQLSQSLLNALLPLLQTSDHLHSADDAEWNFLLSVFHLFRYADFQAIVRLYVGGIEATFYSFYLNRKKLDDWSLSNKMMMFILVDFTTTLQLTVCKYSRTGDKI